MTKFNIEEYDAKVYPAGTKIVIFMYAGCAGTDSADFFVLRRDFTQAQLDDECWDAAKNHAESYGYYPESERGCEDDEEDGDGDQYTDNIEGHFEIYDSEKHDGYVVGCGSRNGPTFNSL